MHGLSAAESNNRETGRLNICGTARSRHGAWRKLATKKLEDSIAAGSQGPGIEYGGGRREGSIMSVKRLYVGKTAKSSEIYKCNVIYFD